MDQCISEFESSVSGGYDNVVSGIESSMIDGHRNKDWRSGCTYSIFGGHMNIVSGDYSSVSVGTENIAGDDFSSYQWRLNNTAPGDSTCINVGNIDVLSGYWISIGWGDRINSSSNTLSISGSVINYASVYVSTVGGGGKNKASTKYSLATGGGRNVDLGVYYIFVGVGCENYTEDDSSSVTGRISNIVNIICACICEGYQNKAIDDSTYVSGRSKHSVDSKLDRSVTVSADILSNDDRGLLILTSSSSSFSSGEVITMVRA